MSFTTFAAIDVGSNELSLKIYEISKKDGIHELEHVRHPILLGSDTYKYGKIRYALVNEVCEVLKNFNLKLQEYDVTEYVAYATSAIREASNKFLILDQIKLHSGIEVKVISNSEQRFLCYKAIAFRESSFNQIVEKDTAIIHAGSGSIQITLFSKGSLLCTQNIRLGVLRIRELLGDMEKMTNDFKSLVMEYINNELLTFTQFYLKNLKIENIIALGEQLDDMLTLMKYPPVMKPLPVKDCMRTLEQISKMSLNSIISKTNLPQEQAALLMPASMIYLRLLEESNAKHIYFCDIGLCDGIAAEYAERKMKLASKHDFTNDIICCARNIALRYQCNRPHNENVEHLALRIFDGIHKLHGLGKRERLLLKIAVTLHNCGDFINMNHSRENSYHIIMSTEIIGLSHQERELIARLVSYTTEDFQENLHSHDGIETDIYLKTAKLFAIFSIAHVLDKSHKQKLKEIKLSLKPNDLTITAYTLEDITLESGLFDTKASFFEDVYGIRPHLKQKRRLP